MSEQPLISVIVPVYKVEPYLDRCVQSIVNQTYKNLEIILVDDGSPDNSPAMCDAWAEKDSRIRVIHKENGGVSSARNAGLDAATGGYITFVDADDWIESDMLEFLLHNMFEFKVDISGCTFSKDFSNGETSYVNLNFSESISLRRNVMDDYFQVNTFFYAVVTAKLYKFSMIENTRFDASLSSGEDEWFNYLMCQSGCSAIASTKSMYHYVMTDNSITRSKLRGGQNWIDNVKMRVRVFDDQDISSKHRQIAGTRLIISILAAVYRFACWNMIRSDAMKQLVQIVKVYKHQLKQIKLTSKYKIVWHLFEMCPICASYLLRLYCLFFHKS